MDKIINEYYIIDNIAYRSFQANYLFNNSDYQFYEVIRVAKKVFLFLEDHLARLTDSLKQTNFLQFYNSERIYNCLNLIIEKNQFKEGNVKLVCKVEKGNFHLAAYYISHYYPTDEQYKLGVSVKSLQLERNQPNLKQISVNEYIKSQINNVLKTNEFYEVLLINKDCYVTEGSKSNIFFIKENTLFSAPETLILKGITRKYILEIASEIGIRYSEVLIHQNQLNNFEAAFISGTSPKILPIKNIDDTIFSIDNQLMRELIKGYNEKIAMYINHRI